MDNNNKESSTGSGNQSREEANAESNDTKLVTWDWEMDTTGFEKAEFNQAFYLKHNLVAVVNGLRLEWILYVTPAGTLFSDGAEVERKRGGVFLSFVSADMFESIMVTFQLRLRQTGSEDKWTEYPAKTKDFASGSDFGIQTALPIKTFDMKKEKILHDGNRMIGQMLITLRNEDIWPETILDNQIASCFPKLEDQGPTIALFYDSIEDRSCTFNDVVMDLKDDQKLYLCSSILKVRSKYFETSLGKQWVKRPSEQDDLIHLDYKSYYVQEMRVIIKFLYVQKNPFDWELDDCDISTLLELGNSMFFPKQFTLHLEKYLVKTCTKLNEMVQFLPTAHIHQMKVFENLCLSKLASRPITYYIRYHDKIKDDMFWKKVESISRYQKLSNQP